jgi:2'-5' RNA ligase
MEITNFPKEKFKVNEYIVVLKPHEELANKIKSLRDEFAEKFQTNNSRFFKPHIALVNFLSLEMNEERLLHRLEIISMGICPVKIELKDYGSYPSHSIFINVTSKLPLLDIVKQLKTAQSLFKLSKDNKPHFIEDPHISIAGKLKPWQYEQGWLEFSHRNFSGRFIADNFLLLKKNAETKNAFQIVKRFEFRNLPVTTKQGELFI